MTDEANPPSDAAMAAETPGTPDTLTPASSEPALLADAAEPVAAEPLEYETFKLPEGATVDGDSLAAATELFRASSLNQEQAQKFIDLAVSREQAAARKGA